MFLGSIGSQLGFLEADDGNLTPRTTTTICDDDLLDLFSNLWWWNHLMSLFFLYTRNGSLSGVSDRDPKGFGKGNYKCIRHQTNGEGFCSCQRCSRKSPNSVSLVNFNTKIIFDVLGKNNHGDCWPNI